MNEDEQATFVVPHNYKGNARVSIFNIRNVVEGSLVFVVITFILWNIPGLEMWLRISLITFLGAGGGLAVFFGIQGYSYTQYLFICIRFLFQRRKMTFRRIFRYAQTKK